MDPANRIPRATDRSVTHGGWRSFGRCGGASLWLVLLLGCGEPGLAPAPPERFVILPGMPRAKPMPGGLEEGEGGKGELRPSRPRICQTFSYPQESGALDLLLVPDVGRSMAHDEAFLEAVHAFLDAVFVHRRPSFRVGVLAATGGAADLGRLTPIPGSPTPFVTCTPDVPAETCTNGDWETARASILQAVASTASGPSSLGFLAIARALDAGLDGQPAFLRENADLHVVVISDADDLSCPARVSSSLACRSFEACACEADDDEGRVEDFVRLLRGLKGYGYEERVRLSAWVATTADPLPMPDGPGFYVGCAVDPEAEICATPWGEGSPCALHAPRYAAAVRALGGQLNDLCRDPDGLAKIGAFVGGASSDFHLERNPLPSTVETVLLSFPDKSCNHQDSCLEEGLDCIRGRCGQVVSEGGADGWQYVSCSSGIPRNMVRFESSDRLRNRKIEICYDVDVGADPHPCP